VERSSIPAGPYGRASLPALPGLRTFRARGTLGLHETGESCNVPGMNARPSFLRNYAFLIVLLISIVIGSVIGCIFKHDAAVLKPLGDIFLNALFATVVPLVFFSISSAVASMAGTGRLLRIMAWMLVVFAATGVVASSLMVVGVQLYPPTGDAKFTVTAKENVQLAKPSEQIVRTFTVPDFVDLLTKRNMLALILFSIMVGLATSATGEKGRPFAGFLQSASDVFMKVVSFIMYYAPIGLGAYFAYLVGVFGPDLLGKYLRAMALYYPLCIAYFFVAFTAYAYLAARSRGVKTFWSNIAPASLTALATGSSFATIPVNLAAANRIGIPKDISEVVIPIGATIHMDGSCLSAVLKIAFLYGWYNMPFSGFETIATAIGVSLLSGMVMSGIPGGGFTGELLIVTLYGFPPEAFVLISAIGELVDPPATMVNAIGDNVASMMIARIVGGRDWMDRTQT